MRHFYTRREYIQGVKTWWVELVIKAVDIRTGQVVTHRHRVASGFSSETEANNRAEVLEKQIRKGGLKLTAF